MKTVALRTALIWHDEVMDDVVVEKPTKITVGFKGKPTFVVPEIGLPNNFAIVRPGKRGYLLTLAETMRGTICVDGTQNEVADFVRRGDGELAGGFRATPISGRDWGVIELDDSGAYKLFFQFVPIDDAASQPFFTKPVLLAGLGGYLISILAFTFMFYIRGVKVDFTLFGSDPLAQFAEAAARGGAISSVALAFSALVWWVTRQDGESQASLSFSVVLHAALLFMTYQLYDGSNPFTWPGPRALTGNYLVTRLEPEKPPEPVKSSGAKVETASAPKTPDKPKNTATKNDQGASGGKGEHERARDKNAKPDEKPEPPKVALFEDRNRKLLDNVQDQNLATSLGKFNGIPGETRRGDLGFGGGTGTGVGNALNGTGTTRGSHGHGQGGGGQSDADFESHKGKIDTGKDRPGGGNCATPPCGSAPKEVKVALADPSGDFGGLTADEIDRVVRARQGVFRACYQKELNHTPGIGGKLVIHFQIGGDGVVKTASTGTGSQFRNDAVESCVKTWVMKLHFPAKGGLANVNYPFVFTQGG